jgi:hypothetical protein
VNTLDRKPPLEHFWKQPDEKFYVAADFVDMLQTGESIVLGSSTVTAIDVDDSDATTDIVETSTLTLQDTTKLSVQIKAGVVANSPYKLTYKAVTDSNNILEVDVEMRLVSI